MNIWVIGRSYPQKSNNMQGSFELDQAKMLSKYGHKVTYISCVFHPFKKVRKWGISDIVEDNVRIITYSQIYTIERMKLHFEPFKKRIWNKLLLYVKEQVGIPDIIHVHYPANITIADMILSYQKKGTKVICTEHWSQVQNNEIDKYELRQLEKYAENSNEFLVVSKTLKESIIKLTRISNINVVPNMVNDKFKPIEKKSTNFIFVAIGFLNDNKQFDKIIRVFADKFINHINVKLRIIGSGPDEKKLINLVKSLNLNDQVFFEGRLSREQTAKKLAESDVLLSFSKSETFCVPIVEAWSCGIPVVTSDSISVNEVWDDKLGYKINNANINEFSKKMKYIYENYEIFDKKYIRNYALSNYSEEAIYKKLIYYYSR